MAQTDDTPEGTSASPTARPTAPDSSRASNGEVVPEDADDVEAADVPEPQSRRGAEPTGLTHVEDSATAGGHD